MEVDIEVCEEGVRLSESMRTGSTAARADIEDVEDVEDVEYDGFGPGWFESSRQLLEGLSVTEDGRDAEHEAAAWYFDDADETALSDE